MIFNFKAEFFKNSELEYIFHNVRFSKDTLNIEKAEHIKEKKVQYNISNTTINNMNIKKSTLKLKIMQSYQILLKVNLILKYRKYKFRFFSNR